MKLISEDLTTLICLENSVHRVQNIYRVERWEQYRLNWKKNKQTNKKKTLLFFNDFSSGS